MSVTQRDYVKRIAGRTAAAIHQVVGPRSRGTGILVYHRIWQPASPSDEPTMNVTPDQFRLQLTSLVDHGFRFAALDDLCRASEEGGIPEKTLVVTFDDIFQSVYQNAVPILVELGIPATVFIATSFLDSHSPFPFDKWGSRNCDRVSHESFLPVTRQQCRKMLETGLVQIGAHTHTHRKFGNDLVEFENDLRRCIEVIQAEFELQKIPFAFPFGRRSMGAVTDEMIHCARRLGLTCALTTECEPVGELDSPFGWGRFNVYQWDTAKTIAAKIGGWYGWVPKIQDMLVRRRQWPDPQSSTVTSMNEGKP